MKTCDRTLMLSGSTTTHENGIYKATVLSLGSDPRGDIVDLDKDAFPLPVGMRHAAEAIFDQLPAGRTPGCKRGCERGSSRPCGWRRRLHPPALSVNAARQPPAGAACSQAERGGARSGQAPLRGGQMAKGILQIQLRHPSLCGT